MTIHWNRAIATIRSAAAGVSINDILVPARFRRLVFGVAVASSLLVSVYWCLLASDRFVSEAHVLVQRTDLTGNRELDFSGLLGNTGGGSSDQLLFREYLLSIDMLKALDEKLDLRAHYSNWRRDPFSRLWFHDTPIENFHEYFRSRVSVSYDGYSGVLTISAQAYDPDTALAITSTMLREGEQHMNVMAHALALEQVRFLESQVVELNDRAIAARQAVLDYQNTGNLASPKETAKAIQEIIAQLEAQLTALQTQRSAMLSYLMPQSPAVSEIDFQIDAIGKQLKEEQSRLASGKGKPLNRAVDEFQQIEYRAKFAQDLYKTALVALEKGRIEATRSLRKVSILQAPSEPESSLQPRRLYNSMVFSIVAMLVAGMLQLVAMVVRDHRD